MIETDVAIRTRKPKFSFAMKFSLAFFVASLVAVFVQSPMPSWRVPVWVSVSVLAANVLSLFVFCFLFARHKGRSGLFGIACALLNVFGILLLAILPRRTATKREPIRLRDLPVRRRTVAIVAMAVPFLIAVCFVPWQTCAESFQMRNESGTEVYTCKSMPPYGWATLLNVLVEDRAVNGFMWLLQFIVAVAVAAYAYQKATER